MSEILRRPWLYDAVASSLNPQESQDDASQSLAHFKSKAQLVQIVQFILNSSGTTHILANLSDKFYYIVAFFTSAAIGNFAAHNPTWRITDLQGSIVRLNEFKFVQIPSSPSSMNTVILVVEDFELVGSHGSPTFGDPRYILNNRSICNILEQNVSKSDSQADIKFSENLDPADLLFLETTCTQTLERVRSAFPLVIKESDWVISEEQLRILENVDYARLSKFEFQSDTEFFSAASSEAEPSSPIKRHQPPQRIARSPAKESQAFTQAHSLPVLTQPFAQNSQVKVQSPSRIRLIESLNTQLSQSSEILRKSPVKESSQATTISEIPKRIKLSDESSEPSSSSQKTLPVRFPSSPERRTPASPTKNPVIEFADYSAW